MTTDGRYRQRREPLSPSAMASLVSTELRLADNDNSTEVQGNAKDAYNYFLLRPKGDEEAGKSKVQDGSVVDTIDAVMAELQPMYTVDELVEVKREGPEDTADQAKKESKALNWYWRERVRGEEKLDESVQNALLLRNGYLKVWPETSWKLPYETTLEGPAVNVEAELAQFIQSGAQVREYERVTVQEAVTVEELVPTPDGLEMVPMVQVVSPEIIRVEIMVIERIREVKVKCIAREDFGTSQDSSSQNLQDQRFCFHRRRMTRNEAIRLGFHRNDIWNLESESVSANQVESEREEGLKQHRDSTAADQGGDMISIYECWYKVDADGDGIDELHQLYYGRSLRILRWEGPDGEPGPYADEIVRVVPIASGVALRVANRHLGRSLFDKIKNTEDIKRTLKRQMNDNLYQANDREFLIGNGASEEDFELGFSGGYKRVQNVQTDARQIDFNPIINESLAALQYYDSVRSERGGAALDNAGQGQPTNIQARTFERWMTATERSSAMYIRNIATTLIRDAFVLLHQALRTLGDPIDFEIGNEWVREEPRFWIDRQRFSVTLGKSEGERNTLIAHYENQIQKASEAIDNDADGVMIDYDGLYEMVSDQANLMGVENHWLDPSRVVGQGENGEPITAEQRMRQNQAQSAQEAQAAQERQSDKLFGAQMQITTLQEETKRLRDNARTMIEQQQNILQAQENTQKALDSIRDFVTSQTKLEVEAGKDIPGGVLYEDEDLSGRVTQ